jgi:hypothetical protein
LPYLLTSNSLSIKIHKTADGYQKFFCLLNLKGKELGDILQENAEETLGAPKIKKQQKTVGNCIWNSFMIGSALRTFFG